MSYSVEWFDNKFGKSARTEVFYSHDIIKAHEAGRAEVLGELEIALKALGSLAELR